MSVSLPPKDFSRIPLLDYSLVISSETRPTFISQLQSALIHFGFLYLSNAPVDVGDVRSFVPRFFDLPEGDKNNIRMENSAHFLGYNRLGSELTKGQVDYREQIDIGSLYKREWKQGDPVYRRLWGPPQYPADYLLPGFRRTIEKYLSDMGILAKDLTSLIAEALGLPPDGLSQFFDSDENMQHFCKMVRYPAAVEGSENNQGVGPHYDAGFVTILLQASDHPGLQVQNLVGQWIDVPPIPNTFVINFGRSLEVVTKGIVRATSHRVLSPPAGLSVNPRYSVPYFYNISLDAKIYDPKNALEFPDHVLALRDARGFGADADALNFPELASETFGLAALIGRIKSHPDVAARHYRELFCKYFPDGIPEHFRQR